MPKPMPLVQVREPPTKRRDKAEGGKERDFSEGAIMLAFAMHLLDTVPKVHGVEIHPDGEHGKKFDIRGWLESRGYQLEEPRGSTTYGGLYRYADRAITVFPKSGLGDVVAEAPDLKIVAECKGGIINTTHAGLTSKLRSGLCEAVGQLMVRSIEGERHIAVVPKTPATKRLAEQMAERCAMTSIELALVNDDGSIEYATS